MFSPKYAFVTKKKRREIRLKKVEYILFIVLVTIVILVFFAKFSVNGKEVGFMEWFNHFVKNLKLIEVEMGNKLFCF